MKKSLFLSIGLLVSLALSSCLPTQTLADQPTADPNAIAAAVVQTIQAQYAQETASAPTATSSPTITLTPSLTSTSTSTFTAIPSLTPVNTAVAAASIPCNQATFIEDVTIPDGTQISAGDEFTKTWRLENTGSCTWTPAYLVIFDHGDLMGGPSSFNMPGFINPGQTVDISVGLTAPTDSGTYEGFWKLEDSNGNIFALGQSLTDFDVQIVVGNTLSNFEVRHVFMDVDNKNVTAVCPPGFTFKISAEIWTNGDGDVVYRWEFSDGKRSDEHTLHFDSDRHRTVTTSFTTDETGKYWVRIHTSQPDDNNYDRVDFSLTCTPAPPTNTKAPTITWTPTHTKAPTHTRTPTHTPQPTRTKEK